MPSYQFDFNKPDFPLNGVVFTWIPLAAAIFIGKLFSNIFERVATSVKVIYFTVFYAKITHPDSIAPDLREELTRYLKLDQVDEVNNLDQQDPDSKAQQLPVAAFFKLVILYGPATLVEANRRKK
jgi:hypothetical protein